MIAPSETACYKGYFGQWVYFAFFELCAEWDSRVGNGYDRHHNIIGNGGYLVMVSMVLGL